MVGYYTFFQALVLQSKYIVKLLLLPLLLLSSHVTSQCTGAHMPPVVPHHVACHAAVCYCLSYCLLRCCVLLLEGVFNKRHSEATTNVGLKYRCTWCGIVSTRVRVNV